MTHETKWNLAVIQQYIIDEVQESLTLDYKAADALSRSDSKRDGITKDVSAMANSAGGVILYGVAEYDDKAKKHLPERIDPVDQTVYSKEWLEQIIISIRPHIDGVVIHPVPVAYMPHGVIYVIEIPQSNTAHQALDRRYYKRYNFQSVPMYDYEIRDIMGRLKHPFIEVVFRITFRRVFFFRLTRLYITAKNVGNVLANYVDCTLYLPPALSSHELSIFNREIREINGEKYFTLKKTNTERDEIDQKDRVIYGPSWFNPILPAQSRTWQYDLPNRFNRAHLINGAIHWEAQADNAPVRSGVVDVTDIEVTHETTETRKVWKALWREGWFRIFFILMVVLFSSQIIFYLWNWIASLF